MAVICRRCKSDDIERTHRGPIAKMISNLIPLKRYKCRNCLRKFYIVAE